MNNKDQIILDKLIERIQRTLTYCSHHTYLDFEQDTMLQEACVFNILQIGKLSKQALSQSFVEAHPEIPWRQMYGLRNHIVRGYEGVRLNIVWDTITQDFPTLLLQLEDVRSKLK